MRLQTMTDKGRLLTGGSVKSRTVISARVSLCDFVVKFSRSMCVAVVTGEMAARSFAYHMLIKQQTVTNPTVIHGLCA